MKSRLERYRIPLSRVAVAIGVFVVLTSDSYWETRNKAVPCCLFFIGTILVGIACLGRMWCSLYIAGYKDNRLVTEGPYSLCRNPLYLFSMLGVLGIGCCTETFTLPLAFVGLFAVYYPSVIKREETRLAERFGVEFQEYKTRVPAFFPRFSTFCEPENYNVRPAAYRRAIHSTLWFVWIVGVVEVIEGMREAGLLASLWTIY